MDHWLSRHFSFQEYLSLLLVFFILTSCDSVAPSAPRASTVDNSTELSQNLKPAYDYAKSQKIAGIFVKLYGFICTEGPYPSNLTIVTNQLSYDAGSAQIIQNYLQLVTDNASTSALGLVGWIPPVPPKELQWVPGSTKCYGNIAITNTTHASIEVQRFGIQLTMTPTINSYHYRRVSISPHCYGCGGIPPCDYTGSVTLNGGITGDLFDSPIASTDSIHCPLPLTISSLESAELTITLQDADIRDMIYAAMPTLEVSSSEKPISLSALTSNLYFSHTDELPCYRFQEDSFVSC